MMTKEFKEQNEAAGSAGSFGASPEEKDAVQRKYSRRATGRKIRNNSAIKDAKINKARAKRKAKKKARK